jgi:hypothetical protein
MFALPETATPVGRVWSAGLGPLVRGIHIDADPLIGPVDQQLEVRQLGRADARAAQRHDLPKHKCINER